MPESVRHTWKSANFDRESTKLERKWNISLPLIAYLSFIIEVHFLAFGVNFLLMQSTEKLVFSGEMNCAGLWPEKNAHDSSAAKQEKKRVGKNSFKNSF